MIGGAFHYCCLQATSMLTQMCTGLSCNMHVYEHMHVVNFGSHLRPHSIGRVNYHNPNNSHIKVLLCRSGQALPLLIPDLGKSPWTGQSSSCPCPALGTSWSEQALIIPLLLDLGNGDS